MKKMLSTDANQENSRGKGENWSDSRYDKHIGMTVEMIKDGGACSLFKGDEQHTDNNMYLQESKHIMNA
jgi:hypothetical protein